MYSVDAAKEPEYEPQEPRDRNFQTQKRLFFLVSIIVLISLFTIHGFITKESKRPPVNSPALNPSKNDVANVSPAAEPISPTAVLQESPQTVVSFFTKHARVVIPVTVSCLVLLTIIGLVTGVVLYRRNLQRIENERLAEEARIAAELEAGVTDGAGKETFTFTWTEWWGRNLKVIYGTSILCGLLSLLLLYLISRQLEDAKVFFTPAWLILISVLVVVFGCGLPLLLFALIGFINVLLKGHEQAGRGLSTAQGFLMFGIVIIFALFIVFIGMTCMYWFHYFFS